MADRAQPGAGQVALVAAGAVAVVLGAAVATGLLPEPVQRMVFHAPLAIIVLIVGTTLVLWRVASRRATED